jgi:hypothetical protein
MSSSASYMCHMSGNGAEGNNVWGRGGGLMDFWVRGQLIQSIGVV